MIVLSRKEDEGDALFKHTVMARAEIHVARVNKTCEWAVKISALGPHFCRPLPWFCPTPDQRTSLYAHSGFTTPFAVQFFICANEDFAHQQTHVPPYVLSLLRAPSCCVRRYRGSVRFGFCRLRSHCNWPAW
jgi:hypothetical protein